MSSERRLEQVEARVRSLEKDLTALRGGGRLGPFRSVPSSTVGRLRQTSLWQACVGVGLVLVVAAIVIAVT